MTGSDFRPSLPSRSFLFCFSDTEGRSNIQTAANQLPPLSPVSGRVSDDPPSSGLSDRLTRRVRGCGDSASFWCHHWAAGKQETPPLATTLKSLKMKSRLQDPEPPTLKLEKALWGFSDFKYQNVFLSTESTFAKSQMVRIRKWTKYDPF